MQFFLAKQTDQLAGKGYLYPKNYAESPSPPKHQWLVSALLTADLDLILDNFRQIFSQLSGDIHTVILSTEGVFNHWFDFSAEAKSYLMVLADQFDMQLWVWFRHPILFMNSYYQQNLKNPRMELVTCYGQDFSFSQMLENTWFTKHLDYLGFIYEAESIFGAMKIKAFNYQNDNLKILREEFGLSDENYQQTRENAGLTEAGIQILRIFNRYALAGQEKAELISHLRLIDKTLSQYASKLVTDVAAHQTITQLFALESPVLSTEYGIHFPELSENN